MNIIDRRPEKPYKIEDVINFKINFEKGDDGDSIDKKKMREEIKDRLKVKEKVEVSDKLNVRFSQNYAETQRKGAPEGVTYVMDKDWQSWNSIDLPILKKGSVICDEKELTDYAFLIPWKQKKCYIILYFSKTSMKKLLSKKEELQSFRDYKNAQDKMYRKFDFYFTYSDNESTYIQNVSIIRKLLNRLKDFFV